MSETFDFSKQDEWQKGHDWPALRTAIAFAESRIPHWRHSEAVADCDHCNFGYIVGWVKRQIETGTPSSEGHASSAPSAAQEK